MKRFTFKGAGLAPVGWRRVRACSRHRIRAGGQSIQPPRSHASLKPSGPVSARRQQSAGFGPPLSGCERFHPYVAIAHARVAIHCEGQTAAEAPALRRTALRRRQRRARSTAAVICDHRSLSAHAIQQQQVRPRQPLKAASRPLAPGSFRNSAGRNQCAARNVKHPVFKYGHILGWCMRTRLVRTGAARRCIHGIV